VIATTFTPEQGRALAASASPVFAELAGLLATLAGQGPAQ